MSIDIPSDLEPLVQEAVAKGHYRDEQQLVTELLRLAAPAMDGYQKLRSDACASLEQADRGAVKGADFEAVRRRLCEDYNESGTPR